MTAEAEVEFDANFLPVRPGARPAPQPVAPVPLPARRARAATAVAPYAARLVEDLPADPPRQVVAGLLGGGLAVMVGQPGGGKTAVTVHLAAAVAAREPFLGRRVHGGPVVYFAAEAPGSAAQRIRAEKRAHHGGRRLPLYLVGDVPRLGSERDSAGDLQRMLATVGEVAAAEGEAVALIVVDTLGLCIGAGDENGAGMLTAVVALRALAETTGATVLALHHPSKADTQGLRGHSSLGAAADSILHVAVDELSRVRTVTPTKLRDGAVGVPLGFTLEGVEQPERDCFGDAVRTVVVRPADPPPAKAARAAGANQQRALVALREWARCNPAGALIASDDLRAILKAQRVGRQRRPEVLDFLARAGVLQPAVGGHVVVRELLL